MENSVEIESYYYWPHYHLFWEIKYKNAYSFLAQSQSQKIINNQDIRLPNTFSDFKSQLNADYQLLMKLNILDLHDLLTGDYEYFKELHKKLESPFMY